MFKRVGIVAVLLMVAGLVAVLLMRPPAPLSSSASYGDWRIDCSGDATRCILSQRVLDGQSGGRLVMINLAVSGGKPRVARLVVPLGSIISAGAALVIGELRVENLLPETCDRGGCTFSFEPDPNFLAAASDGGYGSAVFSDASGSPVSVPFSLNGFKDALATAKAETGLWGSIAAKLRRSPSSVETGANAEN